MSPGYVQRRLRVWRLRRYARSCARDAIVNAFTNVLGSRRERDALLERVTAIIENAVPDARLLGGMTRAQQRAAVDAIVMPAVRELVTVVTARLGARSSWAAAFDVLAEC